MFSVAQHLVLIRYSPGKTHLPCRYYCPFAKADAVIELLLSDRPLPAQQDLPEVTARLGTGDFQHSVLSMLSRDPAERPTVAQLFEMWGRLYPQPGVSPVGAAPSSHGGASMRASSAAPTEATPPSTPPELSGS